MFNNSEFSERNFTSKGKWSDYYDVIKKNPSQWTLNCAIENFDRVYPNAYDKYAIDLGCGSGRDTLQLLKRDWKVLAIDMEQDAINRLKKNPESNTHRLETLISKFEEFTFPENVDLINASFSLPFCHPDHFGFFWKQIVTSLRPGGFFSGHFFGVKDTWSKISSMNFQEQRQVDFLLRSFNVIVSKEEQYFGSTALEDMKFWHVFHIVAQKM